MFKNFMTTFALTLLVYALILTIHIFVSTKLAFTVAVIVTVVGAGGLAIGISKEKNNDTKR